MRRGSMMVLALLAATTALTALPEPAGARQRSLPGALFGAITRPLGAILGGPRHYGRRHYSRRTARSRAPAVTQPPAAVSTAAAGAAVAGTAAVAAVASGSPAAAKPAVVEAQPGPSAGTPASPQPVEAAAPPAEKTSTAKAAPAAKDPAPATTPAASSQDSFAAASKSTPIPAPAQPVAAAATTPASPAPSGTATAPAAPSPAAATTAPDAGARSATVATPAPASTAIAPAATPPVAARVPSQRNAVLARPAEQSSSRSPEGQQATSTANQPPRGQNRLGFAGPLAWPTAFEDVVGFTLWPGEYGERLRGHGIGDVMSAVMVPASTLLAQIRPGVAMARTDGKADTPARSGGICSIDPASEEWPAAQIERSLQLNAAQRDALAQFKTAFRDAAASIKSACRDEATVPPVERLRAMQSTLWAIHDAVIGLRSPLAKFFDTLSDEQRQKFAAPASAQADPRSMTPAAIAKLCGAPQSNEGQARQAERHLNLTKAQRGSLDAFQKKSAEMGQFLMASCLKPVASTPVERIDAAADRLTALIFAASSVNLALNDFYNQLNDEQKAKFNTAVR